MPDRRQLRINYIQLPQNNTEFLLVNYVSLIFQASAVNTECVYTTVETLSLLAMTHHTPGVPVSVINNIPLYTVTMETCT